MKKSILSLVIASGVALSATSAQAVTVVPFNFDNHSQAAVEQKVVSTFNHAKDLMAKAKAIGATEGYTPAYFAATREAKAASETAIAARAWYVEHYLTPASRFMAEVVTGDNTVGGVVSSQKAPALAPVLVPAPAATPALQAQATPVAPATAAAPHLLPQATPVAQLVPQLPAVPAIQPQATPVAMTDAEYAAKTRADVKANADYNNDTIEHKIAATALAKEAQRADAVVKAHTPSIQAVPQIQPQATPVAHAVPSVQAVPQIQPQATPVAHAVPSVQAVPQIQPQATPLVQVPDVSPAQQRANEAVAHDNRGFAQVAVASEAHEHAHHVSVLAKQTGKLDGHSAEYIDKARDARDANRVAVELSGQEVVHTSSIPNYPTSERATLAPQRIAPRVQPMVYAAATTAPTVDTRVTTLEGQATQLDRDVKAADAKAATAQKTADSAMAQAKQASTNSTAMVRKADANQQAISTLKTDFQTAQDAQNVHIDKAATLAIDAQDAADKAQGTADSNAKLINSNKTDIATNKADITSTKAAVATNTADVAANKAAVATNTADVAANKAAVAKNTSGVATNKAAVAVNTSSIHDEVTRAKAAEYANTQAITHTNTRVTKNEQRLDNHESRIADLEGGKGYGNKFNDLKNQVDQNRKHAAAGTSSAMAMANIPQVLQGQTFAVGAGIGGYDGENGVAVGFSARVSESVVVKATVSDDSQQNFGYGAGVSVGW